MSNSNIPTIRGDQSIVIEPAGDNTTIELDDGTVINVGGDMIIGLEEGTMIELGEDMLVRIEDVEDEFPSASDPTSDTSATGVHIMSTKSAHLRISSIGTQAEGATGAGHSRGRSSTSDMHTFQQKVKKTFKNFPDCTCGLFVHSRDCPRFAMKIRFEKGHVVGVNDGEATEETVKTEYGGETELDEGRVADEVPMSQTQLQAPPGPPNDATFSKIAEDRSRSPIPFARNAILELIDGSVVDAEVSEGVTQIALRLDGKVVTFRPI